MREERSRVDAVVAGLVRTGRTLCRSIAANRLFTSALVMVYGLQMLIAVSFPLNIGAFDNGMYLEMARTGRSNLILAPGYPFVLNRLLALARIDVPTGSPGEHWLMKVQIIQNLFHAAALLAMALLVHRLFGRRTATWFVVIVGTAPLLLASLQGSSPEWMQADLIALCLLIAATAHRTVRVWRKAALYVTTCALLTLAYVVKFNSAVVAPFVILVIVLDRVRIWQRAAVVLAGALVSFVALQIYITGFHEPTTGTRQLSYDHAWVMVASLPADQLTRPAASLGTETLRWLALCTELPAEYTTAGAFQTVTTGAPAEAKAQYRPAIDRIMGLDRAALLEHLATHPLPAGFWPGASSIPLYWYMGIPETDALGIAVYKETLRQRWPTYAGRIWRGLVSWRAPGEAGLPTTDRPLGLTFDSTSRLGGWTRYTVPADANVFAQPYWNPSWRVWLPGMVAVRVLDAMWMPGFAERLLILLAGVAVWRTRDRLRRLTVLAFTGAVLAIGVAGFMLLGLRRKEYVALIPTLAVVEAFTIAWATTEGKRLVDRWRGIDRASPGAPDPALEPTEA